MKLFFAGAESGDYGSWLKEAGVPRILESAFYLKYEKQPNPHGFAEALPIHGGFPGPLRFLY